MNNMGSAGTYGSYGNAGAASAMLPNTGGFNASLPKIAANQVTEALQQAQIHQDHGRFNDAIALCEQILASGFDRPDARYFLGWLYQEQQRWIDAIGQFQALLNDPDYALSCFYSLGQCYRASGDLRAATVHFDEAVDRVNLDALTVEESDQLVQLCQEAAEAHRLLGEHDQAFTVYNALLGFLRSRGWNEKVAQVEFMLQQAQRASGPDLSAKPANNGPRAAQPAMPPDELDQAPTMAFNSMPGNPPQPSGPTGDLPDWLTGIMNDDDKTYKASPPAAPPPTPKAAAPIEPETPSRLAAAEPAPPSWLTESSKPNATRVLTSEPMPAVHPSPTPTPMPVPTPGSPVSLILDSQPIPAMPAPPVSPAPGLSSLDELAVFALPGMSVVSPAQQLEKSAAAAEDLLSQMAGTKANALTNAAEPVLVSTASLPENVRVQVVRSMQDIQKYISHGLLTPATEECLRVINLAPNYLDVHQVLCEIYVRQGKVDQAIPKYAAMVETYIASGRIEDAIATYRRILQLDPNNITYRMRLVNFLAAQGNSEDLLRERTLAAESYLRLGYMDRAMAELELALQENPTNVPTRLNYALALHKLGRTQQATAEYQRVLQIDPRNITALVRSHIAMITSPGTPRGTSLEVLSRIRWQLRGGGQKHADFVIREYLQALDIHPNNADVHYALGQIYHQCGQFDRALDSYLLAMRDNAVEVLGRVSAAQALFSQGRPEPAMQHLELALQQVKRASSAIDPAMWAARPREDGEEHQAPEVEISLQLAEAYKRTGREEQMQALLRQVKQVRTGQDQVVSTLADISVRSEDPEGTILEYLALVKQYRQNKQTDNALHTLNELVRFANDDPRAHEELVDIYIKRGLLDEGIAELRVLADIYLRRDDPEQAALKIQQIGNIYAEMGDNEEALTSLFRAAELDGNSMDVLREVVGLCLQLGRNQDAARYQIQIARYYVNMRNRVTDAVAALQQLITIDRYNYEAYDLLGQTYQSVGEYEQASRVYRNLAKLDPASPSPVALERLATLQELRLVHA